MGLISEMCCSRSFWFVGHAQLAQKTSLFYAKMTWTALLLRYAQCGTLKGGQYGGKGNSGEFHLALGERFWNDLGWSTGISRLPYTPKEAVRLRSGYPRRLLALNVVRREGSGLRDHTETDG